MLSYCLQEMAAGVARRTRLWGSFKSVLVPSVPPSLRCPGPHVFISSAGGGPSPHLQQRTALLVSKLPGLSLPDEYMSEGVYGVTSLATDISSRNVVR